MEAPAQASSELQPSLSGLLQSISRVSAAVRQSAGMTSSTDSFGSLQNGWLVSAVLTLSR